MYQIIEVHILGSTLVQPAVSLVVLCDAWVMLDKHTSIVNYAIFQIFVIEMFSDPLEVIINCSEGK